MSLIHSKATPQAVDFLRKWVFGLWLIIVVTDSLETLSLFSPDIFCPTGIALNFIHCAVGSAILSEPFLWGIKIFIVISLLCVLLNKGTLPASLAACFLLTLYEGILRSVTFINHAEIGLLYATYFLTLCLLANGVMKDKLKETKVNLNTIPFIGILMVMCTTYSFMGVYRIVYGGIEVFTSESLIYWMVLGATRTTEFPWSFGELVLQGAAIKWVLKAGFLVSTVFEALAPLCLISHRFRRCFIAFMIPFHIIILFSMNILFWEQMALYILLFDVSDRLHFPRIFRKNNAVLAN